MPGKVDLELLRSLVALADHGTLAAAGRARGLTEPAVHQQLGRLRDEVGVPLATRDGRRLRLTPAGEALAALGRRVADDAERTLAGVRGEDPAPPVVIAGRGVWTRRVAAFPGCRPRVGDGPAVVAAVRDGTARLGVAAVAIPDDLRGRALWSVREQALVPRDHPLAGRRRLRWSELAGHRFVLPPRGRPLREAAEARVGPLDVAAEVEGWDLLTAFVRLGAGVTVTNDDVPADGLAAIPLSDGATVVYRALWRRGDDVEALLAGLFTAPARP